MSAKGKDKAKESKMSNGWFSLQLHLWLILTTKVQNQSKNIPVKTTCFTFFLPKCNISGQSKSESPSQFGSLFEILVSIRQNKITCVCDLLCNIGEEARGAEKNDEYCCNGKTVLYVWVGSTLEIMSHLLKTGLFWLLLKRLEATTWSGQGGDLPSP